MLMDGSLLVMSLAVAGYLGWSTLTQLRTGEMPTLTGPVIKRAEKPELFWFAAWLTIAMAAFFLALASVSLGNMLGWWAISL